MNSVYAVLVGAVSGKRSSCEPNTGILEPVSRAAMGLICTVR